MAYKRLRNSILLRGGSWFNDGSLCCIVNRLGNDPSRRSRYSGFRIVRKANPPSNKGEKMKLQVSRGGNWVNFAAYCRVGKRYYDAPSSRYNGVGFRVVRNAKPISHEGEKMNLQVRRGGTWFYHAPYCRVAGRHYIAPSCCYETTGFRVVRKAQSIEPSRDLIITIEIKLTQEGGEWTKTISLR